MRKYYVDLMKVLCMICLFLAHVNAPQVIQNIRGFDVSVMVILSGLLAKSSFDNSLNSFQYLKKRVARLVIPSWLFLTFFYVCMILVGPKPSMSDVIKSYLFQRDCGIAGGVWIIWIYLLCAILLPVIKWLSSRKWSITALIIMLVINEYLTSIPGLVGNRLVYYSVFCVIPYGTLLFVGYVYETLEKKEKIYLLVSSVIVHVGLVLTYMFINGEYRWISDFKYPARIYYITYGIVAFILISESFKLLERKINEFSIVTFISRHTLWIYLWQILLLTIVNYVLKISDNWPICWVVLLVGSTIITWIQSIIVNFLNTRFPCAFWRYLDC